MSGGIGQLLVATAAAVIGFVVSGGNPMGAAIGFSIGMMAGGIIWPADGGTQVGPRLADKEVQSSAYGVAQPLVYGSYRLSGNIIWSLNISEQETVKRVGKTLFSKGTKVYSYTYFGHFAVAVCEGPINSIGRIWADNKLIHDPNVETAGRYDRYITKYLGTEDQLPHATIQADQGVNATPAFRGTAYIVFDGLPLANFSNRIPTISVEIGGQAQSAVWRDGTVTNIVSGNWTYTPSQPTKVVNTWSTYLTIINPLTLTSVQFVPFNTSVSTTTYSDGEPTVTVTYPLQDAATALFGGIYGPGVDSTLYSRAAIDPATGDIIVFLQGVTSTSMVAKFSSTTYQSLWVRAFATDQAVGQNWVFGDRVFMVDQNMDTTYCIRIDTGAEVWRADHDPPIPTSVYGPITSATYCAGTGTVYWTYRNSSLSPASYALAGVVAQSLSTGTILASGTGYLTSNNTFSAVYDAETNSVILVTEEGFTRLDPTTLAITATYPMTTPWQVTGNQLNNMGLNNAVSGSIWLTNGIGTFYQLATADFSVLWTGTIDGAVSGVPVGVDMGDPFHISGVRQKFFGNAYGASTYLFGSSGTDGETNLASIVGDICDRCRLDDADYDVTGLTSQVVPGYGLMRETTGRAAIEPLLSSFAVDAPEINGILHFQFRKTSLDGTITADDLGATGDNSQVERITEVRRQEVELPAAVTVTYSSRALDYEQNTQSTKRIDDTIEAGDPRSQEFPLVLSDQDALTLSSRLLYLAWIERTSFSFSLPPKWLIYDPGDVLDLPLDDGSVRILVTKCEFGGDGVVKMDALATDALAYLAPPQSPVVPIFPGQTVPVIEVMTLVVLDAPLLDDADDTFGYYVGAQGTSTSWSGGAAYASQDNTTYEYATPVSVATPIGVTSTVLPDHVSSLIDRTNTLRVVFPYVPSGLGSVTELEMLAGSNRLMVGSELIGFATVTAVGGGVYDLSVLLRGIEGTEWASAHAVSGEQVVLLDTIISLDEAITGLNATRYFKGVSLGDTLDDATAQSVIGTGIRIKPISPVHIAGTRDGSNNLSLTWFRRARVDADWRDGVETPLDEPVEAYEVDVIVSSAVVRTIAASSPAASYAASEQTADGITPGDPVSLKIFQMSTRVGRGYPGVATV
jgi:hypothetical protein